MTKKHLSILSWVLSGLACATSLRAQIHDGQPLELSGYSVSESYDITDDQPLDLSNPHIVRLLYRVVQSSDESMSKYASASQSVTWNQIVSETAQHRLWVFYRTGKIQSVSVREIPGVAPEEPVNKVYLCRCVSDSGKSFKILSHTIPRAWRSAEALEQPIGFFGFLYGRVDDEPVFICRRLQWWPRQTESKLGVTASHVLLAKHGVDIALLDVAQSQNSKRLERADKPIFFQMLRAVGSVPPKTRLSQLTFEDLLTHPKENFGNAVTLRGQVKQCSLVQMTDPVAKTKWGFDHYYQLSMFPPIDGKIEIKNPKGEDLTYRYFPATICVRQLPGHLTPADLEDKTISVSGFHYRFWKYPAEITDAVGMAGQISPLVIARQPVVVPADASALNWFLESMALIVLIVVGLVWWFARRNMDSSSTESLGLPKQIDVSGIGEQVE